MKKPTLFTLFTGGLLTLAACAHIGPTSWSTLTAIVVTSYILFNVHRELKTGLGYVGFAVICIQISVGATLGLSISRSFTALMWTLAAVVVGILARLVLCRIICGALGSIEKATPLPVVVEAEMELLPAYDSPVLVRWTEIGKCWSVLNGHGKIIDRFTNGVMEEVHFVNSTKTLIGTLKISRDPTYQGEKSREESIKIAYNHPQGIFREIEGNLNPVETADFVTLHPNGLIEAARGGGHLPGSSRSISTPTAASHQ